MHAHAETGFDLPATRAFIEKRLTEMGYKPKILDGGSITATVGEKREKTQKEGGRYAFMLRADMDALPIKERTNLPFACKTGNMHACGHDLHTAMLLGAARLLKEIEQELPRPVKLLFQAAEERLEGAQAAIKDGVLERPKVTGAATLHVITDSPLPAGTIVVPSDGVGAPAADFFTITVYGKSCHGSAPQNGVDGLIVGANVLLGLQTLCAREISAGEGAVLTVGQMQGGTAPNVLAGKLRMSGTLRAFDEELRAFMKKRLREIASGTAKTYRARAKVTFDSGCPALINDETLVKSALTCLRAGFGEESVLDGGAIQGDVRKRNGGSEDFAYLAQKVPSLMLGISAGEREKGYHYPLHHEKAVFDEECLWRGAAALACLALG